jgi:glycosyltransferase involved in cell wall biosynthesis
VITTPVGGIVDIIQEGETGFLVPRDDLESLADRIWRLRRDRGLRLRMGLAGRKRVESHFNGATVAATVVGLMRRAAESQPPRGWVASG